MRATRVSELLARRQFEDAVALLRALAAAAPDLAGYQVDLARALEQQGDRSAAIDAWKHARLLVPNSPVIADALERLGYVADNDLVIDAEIDAEVDAQVDAEVVDPRVESDGAGPQIDPRPSASLDLEMLIYDLQHGRSGTGGEDATDESSLGLEDTSEEVATETLARIFESQNHFAEAARIYDLLADREENAGSAAALRARAEDLRRRAKQTG